MSISVACPECAKVHKVKEEAAGKKFRCKGCEAVVTIPQPDEIDEPDPWDVVDDEAEAPPVARKRKAPPAKRSRSSSAGNGMPVTVIVSIAINGVMIAGNLFGIITNVMSANMPGAGGVLIRLGIEIAIIKGLIDRKNSYRWQAIILDAVGLAFAVLFGAVAFFIADKIPQAQGEGMGFLVIVVAVQAVLWITDLVMLLTPSAKEYCNQ